MSTTQAIFLMHDSGWGKRESPPWPVPFIYCLLKQYAERDGDRGVEYLPAARNDLAVRHFEDADLIVDGRGFLDLKLKQLAVEGFGVLHGGCESWTNVAEFKLDELETKKNKINLLSI